VLVVAHENSLRGIIKLLDSIGDQGIQMVLYSCDVIVNPNWNSAGLRIR
jgi:bisphosphoglycerate-dependent phosphoglycerate mutase